MANWMQKTAGAVKALSKSFLQPVASRGGWNVIYESFAGAWQRNVEVKRDSVLSFYAIFSCVTLIASDISKMRFKYVKKQEGVWPEFALPVELAVLEKPNNYQTAVQFRECWMISKMARGNTYVYLVYDANGRIKEMHVLNPDLVLPLVDNESGEVFYQIGTDNLAGINTTGKVLNVPRKYIIHDRFNCLFHPLVGLSPIFAAGVAAMQGLSIIKNGAIFFENMSRPSGILSVPGSITKEAATKMKESWDSAYGVSNEGGMGKTAVLGDDVKYQPISVTAKDAELVSQLRMDAEIACSAYHVPKHKVGVGDPPSYNNIESLDLQYLSQCLQVQIEGMEMCLNEAFEMKADEGIELDLDMLLRMDSKTKIETLKSGVDGGIYTPNEARMRMDLKPLKGGDTVYLQQQNYPMEQLAEREAPANTLNPTRTGNDDSNTNNEADAVRMIEFADAIKKELNR